jgi:hypothetical protein
VLVVVGVVLTETLSEQVEQAVLVAAQTEQEQPLHLLRQPLIRAVVGVVLVKVQELQ